VYFAYFAVILAQFTQRYLLLETRKARSDAGTLDNSKVLYAAEHLDLQERRGYYLIRPSSRNRPRGSGRLSLAR